ncbi:uncharacterized protein LOC118439334 [Folsomia candida]|nr:uncharacterized protein LOC118439334 [Folsomia candida]
MLTSTSATFSFPVTCINGKIRPASKSKVHLVTFVANILIDLARISVYLEWFAVNVWFGNAEIWKTIMMLYIVAGFSAVTLCKIIFGWRQEETGALIKTSFDLEEFAGKLGYQVAVERWRSVWFIWAIFTPPSLASLDALVALFKPCMPPAMTMTMSSCQSWDDTDGGITLPTRVVFAALEYYTLSGVTGTVCLLTGAIILYPVLVMEIWIKYVTA